MGGRRPPGSPIQLAGMGRGLERGQMLVMDMKKYFSIGLLFLTLTASAPGSDKRSFSLSTLLLCLGSRVMVVNGCQWLLFFWKKLPEWGALAGLGNFVGPQDGFTGGDHYPNPFQSQGAPPLLPLLLCWTVSPADILQLTCAGWPGSLCFDRCLPHKASIPVTGVLL